jgi:hypothetical protein
LPIIATYDVTGFPGARQHIPLTYRSLGGLQNLGRCVPVQQTEYSTVLDLDIEKVELRLSPRAQQVVNLNHGRHHPETGAVAARHLDQAGCIAFRLMVDRNESSPFCAE